MIVALDMQSRILWVLLNYCHCYLHIEYCKTMRLWWIYVAGNNKKTQVFMWSVNERMFAHHLAKHIEMTYQSLRIVSVLFYRKPFYETRRG
jgi:hypothetical protein